MLFAIVIMIISMLNLSGGARLAKTRISRLSTTRTSNILPIKYLNHNRYNGIRKYVATHMVAGNGDKDSPQQKHTKDKKKKKEASKYSKTVFLPQTSFDQRANSLKKEPGTI